ncbi:ATP-dependent DNA ligase [Dehalobacter sp. DCM]|uniref:ATP-dependent DNA ligase n=1 Tax=Dehalobacter sp. DCM TaxID=2907827 RepID=UPI00308125F0|nr:ATP-dependent DNA ligase [Dehalobacter sp. DCM]
MELLEVMEPVLSPNIAKGDEWLHQIKWDGIRGITYIENGNAHIYTKSGRERSAFYPELSGITRQLNGHQAVVDGELVVFDPHNKPAFNLIMKREHLRNSTRLEHYLKYYPVRYILFDLLYLDGKDLRRYPLQERKQNLVRYLSVSPEVGITDDFNDGHALFELMKSKNFEGIVSKKKNSLYVSGKKHTDWFKTKINKKILAVIGGLSLKDHFPNSLLLGYYQENRLIYIGSASIGLTQNDLQLLKKTAVDLAQDQTPFSNLIARKDAIWFRPILTCWVSFLEWTETGGLRHPKIIGFSDLSPTAAQGKEYILE